ncbi:phosphoglycerate mutase-like protein [Sphaerulina musiva SO2202]|uniref:Phosphoglycerate mutase-like protein n=1 Tax=Sphaerulina musiva (strain SO2202) TaxID=692275 RepID=M3B5L1_SPHMS|nr:phosphoglycerate mutase-like protein [Sphaerulina musiva SO2202]EMF15077.1 phosphoglycerate mutase-like protein [Sphaerulina musiva SO2202]
MIWSSLTWTALAAFCVGVSSRKITPYTDGYINYTTVPGYFLQDDPTTNASTFNYTLTNFGLINRTYETTNNLAESLTQWQQFKQHVEAMNAAAPPNTVYKVLFMGRHGEGYHNVAESAFGTPAWNCYYAQLPGNGTLFWEDAQLTHTGIFQAEIAHNFWKNRIRIEKIPFPRSFYTSPLQRCLATANITFGDLSDLLSLDSPSSSSSSSSVFQPTIKDLLREKISIHTCDHRNSTATSLLQIYPHFLLEPGFSEFDHLWNGLTAESDTAHSIRMQNFLDDIFSHDEHTWISLTSHSGTIAAILRVIGHQGFRLATGGVLPVLVRGEFLPSSSSSCIEDGATSVTTMMTTMTSMVESSYYTTSTWCHNGPPVCYEAIREQHVTST